MDRYAYDHQDFLILVAAGNSGSAGFYTIGSPATAKNILSVGASMTNAFGLADDTSGPFCGSVGSCTSYFVDMAANLASFSSLGPTFDERMKPDIVAPGFYVSSAYSSSNPSQQTCAVEAKAGTSMATPVTAGSAALVRQYFVDFEGIIPMAALIRAAIIHSATPLSDPDWTRNFGNDYIQLNGYPDTNQGYGLVSLQNVLTFEDSPFDMRYFGACSGDCEEDDFEDMPNVDQDDVFEETFNMATNGGYPLIVTLVWHEPASSSYVSGTALINDLDLTVEAADGTVFLPISPNYDTGAPTTGVNRLDTAEKVLIPAGSIEWGTE